MNSGIYIHIPFCRNKCDYCSFYSIPVNDNSIIESYLKTLLKEIDYISAIHGKINADTVYFGGGTPSILEPSWIDKILNHISDRFILSPETEITLEMNPDDLLPDKLKGLINAGINRIVLGVQSLDEDMRNRIGRRGKPLTGPGFDLFFSTGGFTRCIDIMAGLPGQGKDHLLCDLNTVTAYLPEHISLYLLSVDEETPLGRRFIPDEKFEDLQADIWGIAMDFLAEKGYEHYEISNYALPGFESRHNSKYWDFTPYFGFGTGAHSFVNGMRYANELTVEDYLKCEKFQYEADIPSDNSVIVEYLMTALRRMKGFSREEFTAVTGSTLPESIAAELSLLEKDGMIAFANGRYSLSRKGLYYTDSIIYKLTEKYLK